MFAEIRHSSLRPDAHYAQLKSALPPGKSGAIVTFTGLVRDFNQDGGIEGISLEHYPGMTEKAMLALLTAAMERFTLESAGIVHRVGCIQNNEEIVWVGCASAHRQAAFSAACYIMDMLKQSVPLWKKELTAGKSQWVEAKASDEGAALKWLRRVQPQSDNSGAKE